MTDKKEEVMSLYKAPFRFDSGYIYDADNNVVDSSENDFVFGEVVAEALTEYWRREGEPQNTPAVQPKGLFIDMLAQHEGLSEELALIDAQFAYNKVMQGSEPDLMDALRAAIAAYKSTIAVQPLTVPQGYRLVNTAITRQQIDLMASCEEDGYESMYLAAISAAPEAPAVQPAPSQYGSPELQALILTRALEKSNNTQPAKAVQPMTDEQKRAGFRQKEEEWTFRGMTPWQVWLKACAWTEAAHGIGATIRNNRTVETKRDTTNPDIKTIILQHQK